MRKRTTNRLVSLTLLFALLLSLATPAAARNTSRTTLQPGYYYSQLSTDDARAIYNALLTMKEKGTLQNGVENVTLNLSNQSNQDAVMADFMAARDAFVLDHSELFYVELDKLTVTNDSGTITMGPGREETYLADGFLGEAGADVSTAISAYGTAVKTIADAAKKQKTMQEQVRAAYNGVINKVSYALEADAKPENVLYVRDPYGALVRGEAVCEGYARALKTVLDQLGVENVLVQGMYDDGTYKQPHMWNYVRMDDHRWYMLDATMEDGLRSSTGLGDSAEFFLQGGLNEGIENYQADGRISLVSTAFEFNYPDLSAAAYQPLTTSFTESDGNISYISYKGMGLQAAREQNKPQYILSSYNGSAWYYHERLTQVNYVAAQGGNPPDITLPESIDNLTGFMDLSGAAYFGITDIAPTSDYEKHEGESSLDTAKRYYLYTGGIDKIYNMTKLGEAIDFAKDPPYIVEKAASLTQGTTVNPHSSRLDQGKTYDVTVKFSEALMLVNEDVSSNLAWGKAVNGASFADYSWNAQSPDTVTFTLTTGKNFGRSTQYYLVLDGLVGKESRQAPSAIYFSTYNYNTYDCPKVDWDVNKIHSNTPALISDSDLSTEGWKYADGTTVASGLPNRLSLVATTMTDDSSAALENKIQEALEGKAEVKSSRTYDISLSLCSSQVAYITGDPVQVYVPFPEGYDYEDYDDGTTTFKAYHFDKDGKPEEIRCEVAKGGIIMYCTEFSPFAVVAVAADAGSDDTPPDDTTPDDDTPTVSRPSTPTRHTITAAKTENGDVTLSPKRAAKGSTVTLTITPDEGYQLDTLVVLDKNGDEIALKDKGNGKFTFTMPAGKVTVEAEFALIEVEPTWENPFTDVDEDDWFHDAVAYVEEKGLMSGMTDDSFGAASYLTRAMLAQVLYNLDEDAAPGTAAFTDVADEWFADAVNWAYEMKIVSGLGGGQFGPNNNITREQLATILYNYANQKGYFIIGGQDISAFPDAADASGWAVGPLEWAVGNGLFSGRTNGDLDPQGFAKRAEIASVLMNFCEKIIK